MNLVILFFPLISLSHFIFKNYIIDQNGDIDVNKQSGFTTLRFGIIMSLIIFIFNFISIGNKCNENTTILYHAFISFIPWVFVYSIITILFSKFPGWKAPFSNTFGYLFIRFLSANTLVIDLFNTLVLSKEDPGDNNKLSFTEKKTLMTNIYKDQSVWLNVITMGNIDKMWSSFFGNIEEAQQYKDKLYQVIIVKDKVSEFIWYILLSSIAYSISHRYMTTIKCDRSAEDIEKTANQIDNVIK